MTINLTGAYVKMLYYDRIDASEGNYVNKSNRPKECMIFHHCYLLCKCYKYGSEVSNGFHDISMMVFELENIAISNIKGVDYIWNM